MIQAIALALAAQVGLPASPAAPPAPSARAAGVVPAAPSASPWRQEAHRRQEGPRPQQEDPRRQEDYWQQEVHYTIEAYLDEEEERLEGAGTMVYRNNSPNALDEVFFHLHLNAFRPNSTWARVELRERLDFQSLEDPHYAYERLRSMEVDGTALTPEYPHAPDSTVVRFALPEAIPPGGEVTFAFEWHARPSTLCRRQCRQGRSWDFAQWYPRIAPYDRDGWQGHPLYPQGEFYGEYGVYDVTLDLRGDQVVGATGAVLEGDPGWRPQATSPVQEVQYQRDWYEEPREPRSPGLLGGPPDAGRKRVRFYGERIHHFAWSTSPEYRYEATRHGDVAVHVLFRPGDLDWDLGAAAARTVRALEWLESVFGPYPYPQLTNLHRIEGGGTEFPMVIMDGGPSQSLITHETAHQWAMGIFGSNEWKDAYLDEGMASFLTSWFVEEVAGVDPWPSTIERLGQVEAQGALPVPVATPSEEMPDYGVYGTLAYTKPSVVFYMLRELVGEEAMREGLRLYYERKAFEHVVEEDLRRAIEDASGMDLEWFFDQWFHTTGTLDYAVGSARTVRADGGWTTTATITRGGDLWMPVTVQVGGERVTLEGRERTQTLEVTTPERPEEVVVDPGTALLETDRSNNRVEVTPPST